MNPLHQRLLTVYPEWHNNPMYLSKEEMEHPHKVIAEFFDCYDLKNIRAFLKLWLQEVLRPDEILEMDYLSLHDHVIRLTEAAWVLYTSETASSVKNKKKRNK